jgi:tetratricopeptide (TPR) repeat protein
MKFVTLMLGIAIVSSQARAQQPIQPYPAPPAAQPPYYAPPPSGYPPPDPGYPQTSYPPPYYQQAYATPPPRLVLATQSEAAAMAATACVAALENRHLDAARAKCGEALTRDPSLPFAHLLLAEAEPPEQARAELERAAELAHRASPAERLFVDAARAESDGHVATAHQLYDQLAAMVAGEPRAFLVRGRFRQAFLGDLDGAIADFRKALELEPKRAGINGLLAAALAERGKVEDAQAVAQRYLELAPSEPNAQVTAARVALRRGAVDEAVAAGKKAVALDDKFPLAHAALGDALLFAGRGKEARNQYAALIASDDAALHHEGAMRDAHSWLYEGRATDAERALAAEADLAQKTHRPGDQADALVELSRLLVDRGALAEAGQSLRQATALLAAHDGGSALGEVERHRLGAEAVNVRAMVLAAIGERQLAEARADDLGGILRANGDPQAQARTTALKGWIAARNGDDKTALAQLGAATRPTLRMALALAAARAGDAARARAIMEDLARRDENDLEGALTRPRAVAWLKAAAPK